MKTSYIRNISHRLPYTGTNTSPSCMTAPIQLSFLNGITLNGNPLSEEDLQLFLAVNGYYIKNICLDDYQCMLNIHLMFEELSHFEIVNTLELFRRFRGERRAVIKRWVEKRTSIVKNIPLN